MKKTFIFLLLALNAFPAFITSIQSKESAKDDIHWFGSVEFPGFNALIEIRGNAEMQVVGSVYGTAALHYEFPLTKFELSSEIKNNESFLVTFSMQGQEYTLEGQRYGGVISAKINEDNFFQMYQGELLAVEWDSKLPGLYETSDGRFLVSFREFGGLRAVNLYTGENFTLLKTGPRNYFTWQGLQAGAPLDGMFRFPKDADGNIVAMVVGAKNNSSTYYKTDKLKQKQITFHGQSDELAGTIIYPENADKIPGVVLVHGSGPIYRSALTQQAVMLASMGYAVLIYDKRGTGQSGGHWQGASFEDLAEDALSALKTLENHPFVDKTKTGLQGHSQAGVILPIVATKAGLADFIIIVNGGSIVPWEQSLFDKENDLISAGFNADQRLEALSLMRQVYDYVLNQEGSYSSLNQAYMDAQKKPWFETTDFPKMDVVPSWEANPEILKSFRKELSFDPKIYQRQLNIPTLVLLGAEDQTVPADFVASIWLETMAFAGNPISKVVIVPGAGHGMRKQSSGAFVPEYREVQMTWLKCIFKNICD